MAKQAQTQPSSKRRRRSIVWIGVTLALCLTVSELILRQFFGNIALRDLLVIRRGDKPCVSLAKDGDVISTGYWLRTAPVHQEANGLGFRGMAIPRQRRERSMRVALIGDSFVYGAGVANRETMASQLQTLLPTWDGVRVDVMNFGVPGLNLDEVRWHYGRFVRQWTPDVVLYAMFTNDLDAPFCDTTWGRLAARSRLTRFLNSLVLIRVPYVIYQQWRMRNTPPESIETLGKRLRRGLDSLTVSITADSAIFGLVVLGSPLQSENDTLVNNWSRSRGVAMLNVAHLADDSAYQLWHDAHLSAKGNRAVADSIRRWLPPLVAKSRIARDTLSTR